MYGWIGKISPALLQEEYLDQPAQPCRLIVEMASTQAYRIASYVEANDGKVHRDLMRLAPFIIVELPYEAMHPLAISPHVRRVWSDLKVKALLDVAVPSVGGARAQGLGLTGKDVTVAVIDTGISTHPDLMYPESRIVAWKDLVNDRPIPYDDNGHGTHVSGIIAGNGISSQGKYKGMVPEAKLVGVKVLDSEGSGNTSDVIAALEWCVANREKYNIKVVNLSLGSAAQSPSREDPLCQAVDAAWRQGLVVCVAAGNDGPNLNTINTPGISPSAITVGNLDDHNTADIGDDQLSDSSSRGPTIDRLMKPDILAPGTNIVSLRTGRGYRTLSGTSMATPMVSGAAAQIYQKWGNLKPIEVKNLLMRHARQMGLQPWLGGSRALQLDGVFDDAKKEQPNKSSLFNVLFGADSPLSRFFSSNPFKPVAKPVETPKETGVPTWFKQPYGTFAEEPKEQPNKKSLFEALFGVDSPLNRFFAIKPSAQEVEAVRNLPAMGMPNWFKQLDGGFGRTTKEQPNRRPLFEGLFSADSPLSRFFSGKWPAQGVGPARNPLELSRPSWFKQLDGVPEKIVKEQPNMRSLFEGIFGADSPLSRLFSGRPAENRTEPGGQSNQFNPMALLLLLPALL